MKSMDYHIFQIPREGSGEVMHQGTKRSLKQALKCAKKMTDEKNIGAVMDEGSDYEWILPDIDHNIYNQLKF